MEEMPQSQSRKRKLEENDCDFYAKVLIPGSELNFVMCVIIV